MFRITATACAQYSADRRYTYDTGTVFAQIDTEDFERATRIAATFRRQWGFMSACVLLVFVPSKVGA